VFDAIARTLTAELLNPEQQTVPAQCRDTPVTGINGIRYWLQ